VYICVYKWQAMAHVKFYILRRKDKEVNLPEYNLPIIAKYSYNGKRLEYYTRERCDYKNFNLGYVQAGKDPIRTTEPNSDNINRNLRSIERHIKNIESEAIAAGVPITIKYFRDELKKRLRPEPEEAKMTLTKYFDVYINDLPNRTNERTGEKLSSAMAIKYGTIKNLFADFCKYKGREYDFADMNVKFYQEFKNYMVTEKKYSVNTLGRAMKFLKTILNDATTNKYNNNLEFREVLKGVTEESDNVYLNKDELEEIYKLDLKDNPKLDRVRDVFLIGCWTGLRFSDFTTLKKDDVHGDRIRVKTQKTGSKVTIPLHPTVKLILEKYQYEIPPAISNQKFNDYIKEIAALAKLNEPFTRHITKGGKDAPITMPKWKACSSHTCRRSFATNAYKQKINPVYIMSITGHKTEAEFMKYLKISTDEKADQFEEQAAW
jgi:integrase